MNIKQTLTSLAIGVAVSFSMDTYAQSNESFCEYVEKTAELSMKIRQQGTRLSELHAVAKSDLEREIAKDAYNTPRHGSEFLQDVAVEEFSNKWYRGCLDAI